MSAVQARARHRARVVLVGEDPTRSGHLAAALAAQGLVPSLVFECDQLVDVLDVEDFDLVVIDLGPPADAGGSWSSRDGAATIVAALAGRTDATVAALGGSDAVALELFARGVHALPPRGGFTETARALGSLLGRQPSIERDRLVCHGPLALDVDRRTATWCERPLLLTKLQFRLLVALAVADGALVSRSDLHRALYGNAPVDDGERVVAHVRRVRDKIEPCPSQPEFLLTVRGEGFRLADAF
jgi:DNA-binding response OmpR family regulator